MFGKHSRFKQIYGDFTLFNFYFILFYFSPTPAVNTIPPPLLLPSLSLISLPLH